MALKIFITELRSKKGVAFGVREGSEYDKPKAVFSAVTEPIGIPPIYPVLRGAIVSYLGERPRGYVVDYRASQKEAENKAYDLAEVFVQTIIRESIWPPGNFEIIDKTSRDKNSKLSRILASF